MRQGALWLKGFHKSILPNLLIFDFWSKIITTGVGPMFRGGSRAAATSKMECFVIIVNGWALFLSYCVRYPTHTINIARKRTGFLSCNLQQIMILELRKPYSPLSIFLSLLISASPFCMTVFSLWRKFYLQKVLIKVELLTNLSKKVQSVPFTSFVRPRYKSNLHR